MMDDEIVFLGSSHGTPFGRQPVTGVVLHIEGQESAKNYSMIFRRANTSVVHIGRRPGFESSRSQDLESGNAMFRCAVVSRKHAKIAFSDSGHAYLIDLCSHHGTFVRKPAEKFSRKIETETPTMLGDGDVVTFGKSVGKGDECVRPIVARIELLHAGKSLATPLPIKPLVVPSPSTPPSSVDKSSHSKHASNGGRYGVNKSPSSSSDESYSSHSDIYSDIEEIPPPPTFSKPASVSQSQSQSSDQNNSGSLGQAFSVLKRLLPPTHTPSNPSRLPSVAEIVERPLSRVSSFLFGPHIGRTTPDFVPGSDFTPSSPYLSDLSTSHNFEDSEKSPPLVYGTPEGDIYEDDHTDRVARASQYNKSRSNSPMDLASPSPAPEVVISHSLSILPPPTSPPLSFPPSPLALVSSQQSAAVATAPADMNIPLVNSPEPSPSGSGASSPAEVLDPAAVASEGQQPSATSTKDATASPAITPAQLKQIEESLATLKTDVSKLQSHRRKYKARFNSNVHVISQKLSEFDDRLSEVNAEYLVLANQVDNVVLVEVPDLNGQLESMQERIDEFMDERDEIDKQREDKEEEKEKAMHVDKDILIKKFDAALEEMKAFTKSMNKQMEEELGAVKAVREATKVHLAQMQEEQAKAKVASETPVLTSLKRKRDDIDENEDEVVEAEERHEREREGKRIFTERNGDETVFQTAVDVNEDKAMDVDNGMAVEGDKVPPAILGLVDAPPPRKRARRLASMVAQTATAVTIGAVVTWSALAFS